LPTREIDGDLCIFDELEVVMGVRDRELFTVVDELFTK
jgi:hypothetical protein